MKIFREYLDGSDQLLQEIRLSHGDFLEKFPTCRGRLFWKLNIGELLSLNLITYLDLLGSNPLTPMNEAFHFITYLYENTAVSHVGAVEDKSGLVKISIHNRFALKIK